MESNGGIIYLIRHGKANMTIWWIDSEVEVFNVFFDNFHRDVAYGDRGMNWLIHCYKDNNFVVGFWGIETTFSKLQKFTKREPNEPLILLRCCQGNIKHGF